jgi:CDP-diacylglycerol--serine O-phosphatidyltransferase
MFLSGKRKSPASLNSIIPNILTILALCAGMTAIRFALKENWEAALGAILVAAILDGLDGRMARLLKGATKFGAELDSLSDFIAFGVAPGIIAYLWSGGSEALGGVSWIAALAYAACCALRLARFNTALEDPDRPAWASDFFTGTAAPAAAGFAMLPIMASFLIGDEIVRSPAFMTVWLLLVGFLMISKIPTYSFKRLKVNREHILPTLVGIAIFAALAAVFPWAALTLFMLAYLALMPFSYRNHNKLRRQQKLKEETVDDTEDVS